MPVNVETIYFLTHEFTPFRGGVATYVREAAAGARRRGHAVQVLAPGYGANPGKTSPVAPGQAQVELEPGVIRFPGDGRLNARGVWQVAAAVWQRRALLAGAPLVGLSAGALMALILLERAGMFRANRLVSFFHGSELLKLERRWWWRTLAPGFFSRWSHAGVASEYVANLTRRSGRLRRRPWNLHLAPCACSSAFWDRLELGRGRERLQCPDKLPADISSPVRVLCVARLHPRKGQRELAQVLAGLPPGLRAGVVLQLAGVGSPAYRGQIEQICRLGEVRVEFLGDVPDEQLPGVYADADIYAQASRAMPESVEGFGITYLEASAAGKPIVAFNSGGTPEAVLDGQTGLLAPEGDLEALRVALTALLLDPDLRERLGRAGREHARGFRWDHAGDILCRAALAAYPDDEP